MQATSQSLTLSTTWRHAFSVRPSGRVTFVQSMGPADSMIEASREAWKSSDVNERGDFTLWLTRSASVQAVADIWKCVSGASFQLCSTAH